MITPRQPGRAPTPDEVEQLTLSEGFSLWQESQISETLALDHPDDPFLPDLNGSVVQGIHQYLGRHQQYSRSVYTAPGDQHSKGYLVVPITTALQRLQPTAPPPPAGCRPPPPDASITRWWAASLPLMAGSQPASWVGWCDSMAATAPLHGVSPAATYAVFRSFGVPCGPDDDPVGPPDIVRDPLPQTCAARQPSGTVTPGVRSSIGSCLGARGTEP